MKPELKQKLKDNPTNDEILLEMLEHKEEFLQFIESAHQPDSEEVDTEQSSGEQTDVAEESHGKEDSEEEVASEEEKPDIEALIDERIQAALQRMKSGKPLPKSKAKQKSTKKKPLNMQFGAI